MDARELGEEWKFADLLAHDAGNSDACLQNANPLAEVSDSRTLEWRPGGDTGGFEGCIDVIRSCVP